MFGVSKQHEKTLRTPKAKTPKEILDDARRGVPVDDSRLVDIVATSESIEFDLIRLGIEAAMRLHEKPLARIANQYPEAFAKVNPELPEGDIGRILGTFKGILADSPLHGWFIGQARRLIASTRSRRDVLETLVHAIQVKNDLADLIPDLLGHDYGMVVVRILALDDSLKPDLSVKHITEMIQMVVIHWTADLSEGLKWLDRYEDVFPEALAMDALLESTAAVNTSRRIEVITMVVKAASGDTPPETLDHIEAALLKERKPDLIIDYAHKVRDKRDVTALKNRLRSILYPTPDELAEQCIESGRVIEPPNLRRFHDAMWDQRFPGCF